MCCSKSVASGRSISLTTITAGLFLSAGLFAVDVSATPYTLAPGGNSPALASTYPAGGTVLNTQTEGFSSSALQGSVVSSVIMGDSSNPYGGLTFTYMLTMSSSSPQDLSAFSVGSYGRYLTDVSYNLTGTEVAPDNVIRSLTGNGDTITFQWTTGGGLAPGKMSALLVIQTDATSYQITGGGVIDDTPVNLDDLLAPAAMPAAVPDSTGTATLLAAGLAALCIFARHQSKSLVPAAVRA